MGIIFSQNIIKTLALYLNTTMREIAEEGEFPYSTIYLYKIADGSIAVNSVVNEAFNSYWNRLEMTAYDLENIYNLIDILEKGKRVKQFEGGK